MSWWDAWDSLKQWMAGYEQRQAMAEFSCANCERTASCGRTPSDDCIEKVDQIARGDDWRYRPAVYLGELQPWWLAPCRNWRYGPAAYPGEQRRIL